MATDAVTSQSRTRRRSSRRPAHVGVWVPSPPTGAIRAAALAGVAVALASMAVGWAPAGAASQSGLIAPMPVGRRALALPEFQLPQPLPESSTASGEATAYASAPATVAAPTSAAPSSVVDRSVDTIGGGVSDAAGATTDLSGVISSLAADGIPTTAVDAYHRAAARADSVHPGCGIPWALLAGIGRVESDHGRFAGSLLYSDGESSPPIIGIPLNGVGTALVLDTDHGRLDGDRVYDRAVGPMQFIPGTWQAYGVDGNGDGRIDPFNIYDAAAAAADYLCTAGGDLSSTPGQTRAILAYNYSSPYLASVLALEAVYSAGTTEVPATPGQAQVDLPVPPAPSTPTATTAPTAATSPSISPSTSARPSPSESEDPRPSTSRHRPHPSSSAHGSTSPTPAGGDDQSSLPVATGTATSGPAGTSSEPGDSTSSSCPVPSPSVTGSGTSPSVSLSAPSTAGSSLDAPPTATESVLDIAAAPTTDAATAVTTEPAPAVVPSTTEVTLPTETITVTVSGTTVVVTLSPTGTASPTGSGGTSGTPGPTATAC